MAYIFVTTDDFKILMQEKFLDPNAVGNFDSIMEPIVEMNVGFIKAKLASRYDMEPVFAATQDRNQVILKILIILCNYDFIRRNAARKVPEDYKDDYNWAIKELDRLQGGLSYADLPPYKDDEGEPIKKLIYGNNTNPDNYI